MQPHVNQNRNPELSRRTPRRDPVVWCDGELVPTHRAAVSPLAHGLHYGTGVFEGVRSYATPRGAAVFRLADHLARMRRGADVLAMPLDVDALTDGVLRTLRANRLRDAYLRPLAYYERGGLGLDLGPLTARTLVAAMPWTSHLGEASVRGVRLRTSSFQRNPARAMPPLKLCGGYINSVIAKREAVLAGDDEALFVDDGGFVCEATGENVFLVKSGRVVAVQHPDALEGITRDTVMTLAGATARAVTLDELRDADEVFLTGTSAEVTPVRCLDGVERPIGPVTRELSALYQAVVHGETEAPKPWLLDA